MLNSRKIRVMTKLALYEQDKGKDDIKMGKFYKTDYVRLQMLKTIVSVTLGYALILLMIGMYKSEFLINEAVTLNFVRIGQVILGFYIITVTVYIICAIIGYSLKYDKSRKHLSRYYKSLKKLSGIYNEEKANE